MEVVPQVAAVEEVAAVVTVKVAMKVASQVVVVARWWRWCRGGGGDGGVGGAVGSVRVHHGGGVGGRTSCVGRSGGYGDLNGRFALATLLCVCGVVFCVIETSSTYV